jgi:hypothetical protein
VGRREPPPGWPVACCGRRMRVLTSHESGWRGICRRRALVASCVMLPRVFPEGTSREGGTRLREAPGLDAALQHEVTCSQRLADPAPARRDVFAVRSLDLILTACDVKMRHPTPLKYEGTSREGGTRLREAPGLDAALQHEVTCSQRPADHVTARWDVFAVRSLDPNLTTCDVNSRGRHPNDSRPQNPLSRSVKPFV